MSSVGDLLKSSALSHRSGDLDSAESGYLRILELDSGNIDVHCNLSYLYMQRGDFGESRSSADRALSLDSEHSGANNLQGLLASRSGEHSSAVEYLMKAISGGGANKDTFDALGVSSSAVGDYLLAGKSWRSYLQLEPFSGRALSLLMDSIQQSASWSGLDELELKLRNFVDAREGNMPFYPLLNSELNEEQMKSAATSHSYYLRATHGNFDAPQKGKFIAGSRIKVGYFSSAEKDSLTGLISQDIYGKHGSDFEVFVYGVEAPAGVSNFYDISAIADEDVADKIRGDDLDILVDLDGFRKGNRQRVLLRRPCGVIINYLGHGGTMGSDYHNYIITDKVLLGDKKNVTETPLLVSCASSHNRSAVEPDSLPRSKHGLLDDHIVLGYFGSVTKITPGAMAIWLRIMQKFPQTQLWLRKENAVFVSSIQQMASIYNIPEARIVFADILPHSEHLRRLSHCDLVLDSFPHSSLGCCVDSLQVGIPFITCAGRTMQSRYGVSLLAHTGMLDFFAKNVKEYVEKVCMLVGSENNQLSDLRSKISSKSFESIIFDNSKLVSELEEYYRRIVDAR